MIQVLKTLDMSYLDSIEPKIYRAKFSILNAHPYIQEENIVVLMPDYLNKMWSEYTRKYTNFPHNSLTQRFYGMKILSNVENKIVVGCLNGAEMGIEPIIINIP